MSASTSIANGRYLLVEPLGEGGMATVYRAFDQRLQVWRALKILSPQYANKPRLKARFETEAQTMALLEHKHIVRVYDVGSEGPLAFIVMELVEGGSLVDWLEENGAMPARMAIDVTLQVAEGIAAAHAKGVVHRDIKPHNVLITREGICRVTDFGIARVGDADSRGITKTGAVMGTWGYMAPEQRSDAKNVDERADEYALAASLFTLLTNKMPMDLFAADRDGTMMEGVDARIAEVLVKATEYRREDRYDTVLDFAAALRDLLPDLPAMPDDTPPLARDPGAPPPPPSPEEIASVRPLMTIPEVQQAFRSGGTLLPVTEGNWSDPSPTILPDGTAAGTAPSAPMRQGFAIDPSRDRATVPPPPPRPQKKKRSGLLMIGGVAMGFAGLALFGLAGVIIAAPQLLRGEPKPKEPIEVVEHTPDDDKPVLAVADAKDTDATEAKAGSTETKASTTKTSTKTKASTTKTSTKTKATTTKTPDQPPEDTRTPLEKLRDGDAGTDTKTTTETKTSGTSTAAKQCLNVTEPGGTSVGGSLTFRASLCDENGEEVTLWFRPSAGGDWQSRVMPNRLGARVAKIDIDDRFNGGVDWYIVTASGQAHGSPSTPQTAPVN